VVPNGRCDVAIIERQVLGYRDENGTEPPVYGLGDRVVYHADTGVNVDANDAATRAIAAAEQLLEAAGREVVREWEIAADGVEAAGWEVVGEWEIAADAVYAPVARA